MYHKMIQSQILTLPVPIPDEEKKINLNFIFALFCGASKCFMKDLNVAIKPCEAPQRSEKTKVFKVIFYFNLTF